MKWKDILLGSVMTLIVTVLGSTAVYYITKEPDEKKTEKLIYSVQQSASFTGGNQDLAFSTVKIQNSGGIAAKQVTLNISFESAEIRDFALDSKVSSKDVAREVGAKSIRLKYETLLPSESITLNLMLSSVERPSVILRSDATLGSEKQLESTATIKQRKLNSFVGVLVPLTGLLLAFSTAFFALYIRGSGIIESMSSDKNSTGFLLLHNGMIDDAIAVLTKALHSGRHDGFTLSNLALCKALKGEFEQAHQLLRAANYRERTGHVKAVILFNEALINLIAGHKDDAIVKLQESLSKSPNHIRRYCQRSMHLDAFRNDPAIFDIIKSS